MVTETGCKVDPDRDHIKVEGRALPKDVQRIYVALNKPKGYVTTRDDPHAKDMVMDLIRPPLEARLGRGHPAVEGLHPVGRLDTQTEGLLLLTNDGAFTHALTHPRHQVPKLYVAEVRGIPDEEALERLRTGVPLFGQRTLPARVRISRVDRSRNSCTVEIELREGRQQQVRRMLQIVGFPVDRLARVAVGPVKLERLRPGQWRFLTEGEVAALFQAAEPPPEGLAPPPRRSHSRRRPGPRGQGTGARKQKAESSRQEAESSRQEAGASGKEAGAAGKQKPERSKGTRTGKPGPEPRDEDARTTRRGAQGPQAPDPGARPGGSRPPTGDRKRKQENQGARAPEPPSGTRGPRPAPRSPKPEPRAPDPEPRKAERKRRPGSRRQQGPPPSGEESGGKK